MLHDPYYRIRASSLRNKIKLMESRESQTENTVSNHLNNFLIDQVAVDVSTNQISGPGGEIRLEPRVMEVLCQLAESSGQVVLREDMLDEYGSDEGLTRAISILRKAYKQVGSEEKFIETIPKRGYRMLIPISEAFADERVSIQAANANDQVISLAVLPFLDLSENQDQGHLSDGVSEEIINALAKLPFLRVAGRRSSFSFKGTKASVPHIAKTLGVSHILDGSVRKYGERLRITAQLVESKTDKQVGSDTFDGSQDELFDLQDKVARAVEQTLQRIFSVDTALESVSFRLSDKLTESKEAYNEFLIGRHLMYELSGQRTIPRAIIAFEKAIEADPTFASAWAHLAIANFTLPEYSNTKDWRGNIEKARSQIDHAMSLDPNVAWTHRALAGVLSYDHKFDESVDSYQKALSLEPNDPELLFTNGYIFAAIGLQDKAQEMMIDALDREPLLGPWYGALGTSYFAHGDMERAKSLFLKSFECNFGYGAILYAQLLAHQGKSDEAINFLKNNFDGLGPVIQEQLSSSIIRKLTYSAFFKKSKFGRKVMDMILTRRMNNENMQPSLGTIIGFILISRPKKFFQHVLEKPNPYVGFALSRIWEPTPEAEAVRTHPDFPDFAETIGLVRAWQRYGWPSWITPNPGTDGSNGQFTCK